ncbi:hypothetical protein DCAR_0206040 [Daucus carota subsp. sativus]|uniref:Bifunctional inhibitor/plant lipid transfer protein/seed storage helical domain-containing protein n=1 Tax=Daucus carota subsp. sativus TaxID=79200 RepID=A0AAF1ANA4_DAUCS|nr:PREDICTED: non-specific lipid-transfer protein 1-like [Daucus carota subsp. sativus]WOG86822.1 hypothetical protein DCAR_0206040 [Daucus carota subsp. sativus]
MARIVYLTMVFATILGAFMMVEQGEAFTCGTTLQERTKALCDPFHRGEQQEPSAECCNSLKAFRDTAKTREERIELCRCVQDRSNRNRAGVPAPDARIPKIDALPGKCGLPFIYSADRKFDCNTVN